jgi:hypothetical protein
MHRKLSLIVAAAFVTATAGTGSAAGQSLANGYWTTRACTQNVQKFLLPTTDPPGHNFYAAQAVCVGRGGQQTCQRSARGASRLYSAFTVFTRTDSGGVVRSFALDTHSGHGVPAWGKSSDPPPFYVSHVKLIATNVSPARFRSTVGPIAARLRQHQNARGCARHASS